MSWKQSDADTPFEVEQANLFVTQLILKFLPISKRNQTHECKTPFEQWDLLLKHGNSNSEPLVNLQRTITQVPVSRNFAPTRQRRKYKYARVNPANPRSTTPTPIDPLSQSLSVSGRKSLPAGTSRLSAADSHCKGPEIVEAVAKRMASWEHLLGLSIRQPNPLPVKDDVGDRQRRPSCASMQGMVCCTA